MHTDLDTLLPHAGGEPDAPLDADVVWARGRRRRAVRHVSAVGGGLVGIAALALVATGLVGGGIGAAVPQIAPMAPPPATDTEPDATADAPGEALLEATDEDDVSFPLSDRSVTAEHDRLARAGDRRQAADEVIVAEDVPAGDQPSPRESSDGSVDTGSSSASPAPAGPTPNWARAADPCASHDPGAIRAFIDVASPVEGQRITDGGIALVGCSSVYEGTIRYRISEGGRVVADRFTTASAGGPELGEFREWIGLTTTGTHTLEVFWDSPADGEGERDRTTLSFEVG